MKTRRSPRAATCTRASGRAGSGSPGQCAETEELMVMRDIALARLTGAPRPLPAPVDGGLDRDGAGCARERRSRHGRGDHPPLHLDPRRVRVVRPGVQGEPAVAHRSGRCRGARGPRRRVRRRDRDRPRAPRAGGEGAALRSGASRDARPRDGPRPRAHRARPPDRIGARRCSRGSRPRSRGSPARTGDRSRPVTPPTSASSTRRPNGWSIRRCSRAAAGTRRTPAAS